jgi:hypothetical protein
MEQHQIIISGCLKFNFSSVKYTNNIVKKGAKKLFLIFLRYFFLFQMNIVTFAVQKINGL